MIKKSLRPYGLSDFFRGFLTVPFCIEEINKYKIH